MFENVALMVLLMALGVGVTVAILVGFVYYMEFME
jgi:ABC-type nickel/cobalt efflux system permease component RcnA